MTVIFEAQRKGGSDMSTIANVLDEIQRLLQDRDSIVGRELVLTVASNLKVAEFEVSFALAHLVSHGDLEIDSDYEVRLPNTTAAV